MEGYILNKQETIWTMSDVLWIMQFTRDIPKNDE